MSAPAIPLPIAEYALRKWRESDEIDLYEALNNQYAGRFLADWYPKDGYTWGMAEQWVTGGAESFGGINWAVTYKDIAIGSAGIHPQLGFARCSAEIGYWLAEPFWGKGVGSALVATLTEKAFDMPEITRVFAPIHVGNIASQRICEKKRLRARRLAAS
jgi:[ribosomal protein S5]-alanine N-acetyltransferase